MAITPLETVVRTLRAVYRDSEAGRHWTYEQEAQRILDALAALDERRVLLGDPLDQAGNTE